MRIFYASDNSPNAAFKSDLWRSNLYLALVDLGHDVVEFDYDLSETFRFLDPAFPEHVEFIRHNRPNVTAELLRQVRPRTLSNLSTFSLVISTMPASFPKPSTKSAPWASRPSTGIAMARTS